ncbi:hypothetical protein [Gracilimonas sp.]|uniref:hypothetical protein n=1 Tax=Gracilimonas sp. TaxID=1974203 RepID=UPI002872311B|nr:hypothetical protein [Gracilimonas sp.]
MKALKLFTLILGITIIGISCDVLDTEEERSFYDGENLVKFNTDETTLFAEEEEETFEVGVSLLSPANGDRSFTFEVVDSLTTAVEGEDYRLDSNSFTISNNEVLGSFPVTVIKAGVAEAPTLTFRITSENVASFNSTISITLRQFFPYEQSEWEGTYELVYPWWFGDSEPRTVSAVASSENENIVIFENFIGTGVDFEFLFDDSDPLNFNVSFAEEPAWVSGTYGNVRVEGTGSFDAENKVINGEAEHTVSAGTFGTYSYSLTKVSN